MEATIVKQVTKVNLELTLEELAVIRDWAGNSSLHYDEYKEFKELYSKILQEAGVE